MTLQTDRQTDSVLLIAKAHLRYCQAAEETNSCWAGRQQLWNFNPKILGGYCMYRQWSLGVPLVVTVCTASGHCMYR